MTPFAASTCPPATSCHAIDGSGDVGPSLQDNPLFGQTRDVAETIVNGYSCMPPLGDVLSDDTVAAVMTFIRSNWGSDYPPVTDNAVAAGRCRRGGRWHS
ncbi:c-type cytochrome [Pseudoroseicyclus tamaricis]|uniref:Cytochrome c n=1 Tax=Pseudoroseicyclus tamaricis TaxID=2705421 RepID=A0A6B2JV46_9RHOB|nr:cytochrome c [Pseudoroseicyclus tamaricis]NDV00054.1 cytochrome c [Pseudoroseicyclus tamaricis]